MDIDVEQIIRDYLPSIIHLSLATAKDNRPWASEVHFAYDEHLNLYFRSLPSRRHSQEIAGNPQVAGNIIKQHALGEPVVGVYFEGTAEKLKAPEEQARAARCIEERFQIPADILEEAQRPDGHQFYKITVQNYYLFGKFGSAPTQKYQLAWSGNGR